MKYLLLKTPDDAELERHDITNLNPQEIFHLEQDLRQKLGEGFEVRFVIEDEG